MGRLFNTTTIVSVMVAMLVYFMVVAPMMVKKPAASTNGNGNGNGAA